MKTPITYYGGKQTLLKYIEPLIPEHKLYCEPFFGGGAVFFHKTPSETEVINDVNSEVVNFFKVCKQHFAALKKEVVATLHSRELFKKAKVIYDHPELFDDVKRAWAFWTLTNQGFAGQTTSWGFGNTNSKEKSLMNKRAAFDQSISKRLERVQIESNDALKVIERCDTKDSFFYVDPPYINTHQGHYAGYEEADYEALLKLLSSIKGKFLLSGYPSKLLSKYIKKKKWHKKSIKKSIAVTKHTSKKKVEVLVSNYDFPSEKSSLKKSKIKRITEALKRLK